MSREDIIHVNSLMKTSIYKFDNGNVVFIIPEKAFWIKTSTSGLWIYNQLKDNQLTNNELLVLVSRKYKLPPEAVEKSVNSLIDELYKYGIISIGDKTANYDKLVVDTKNEPLKEIWLNLTSYCNLDCKHCYVPDVKMIKEHMPLQLAYKIIDEAAEMSVSHLTISGGEPTMHPQLFSILSYAKEKKCFLIKLITNGTMKIDVFTNNLLPLLDDVQVSLDGIDKETHDKIRGKDSFEKIVLFLQNITRHKNKVRVGISFTPLLSNYKQIPDLYHLLSKFKVDYFQLTRPKIPGKKKGKNEREYNTLISNDFYQELLDQYDTLLFNIASLKREIKSLKKYYNAFNMKVDLDFDPANSLFKSIKMERCGAGIMTMCINQSGDCFPCAALCSKTNSFGNINIQSLDNIYSKMVEYMRSIFSVDRDPKCKECDFKYFCGGGCRANSDLASRDPLCPTLKNRYLNFIKNIMGPTTKTDKQSISY